MVSQTPKHPDRGLTIMVADILERPRNGGLHSPELLPVRTFSSSRQPKDRTPPIARMIGAEHRPLLHQPLQHTGQRAGVYMKNRGELSRRQPWEQANHAQYESLWPGHTDGLRHSLGCRLKPVHNGPQQLHEAQDVRQLRGGHGSRGWRADNGTMV